MRKLPKFLEYFGHILISSFWSYVNKVRLVQKTKRESPTTITNNVQVSLSACILSNAFELVCYLKVKGKRVNTRYDKFDNTTF